MRGCQAAGYALQPRQNDITALPRLLRLLALEGCVVTIDAIGCRTAIAAQLQEQGADYVLALKSNQPTLHRTVVAAFADLPPASRSASTGRWRTASTGCSMSSSARTPAGCASATAPTTSPSCARSRSVSYAGSIGLC